MFENYRYKLFEISEHLRFRLGRAMELISFVIWTLAIVVGTYAQFALPRWQGGPKPLCYFTDALVIFVECRGTYADGLIATVLNWAWYWTWGLPWAVGTAAIFVGGFLQSQIRLLPMIFIGLLPLVLEVVTAFFAIRLVIRLLRKSDRRRLATE